MTNEELKKKIVEIIINAIWKDAEADYDSTDETEAGSISDALIAAGIGDVKTAQEIGASVTAMAVLEAAKAEHRAEVAEHELERRLAEATKAMYVYERALYYVTLNGETADEVKYNDALKRAQKDFAENKGD